MKIYISLLRGINVSGQKSIQMQPLKELYEKAGFQQVVTYIQSGNVVFASAIEDIALLENKIMDAILQEFGYEVQAIVLDLPTLETIFVENPFREEDTARLYFTFLASLPDSERVGKLEPQKYAPDIFAIVGKMIYIRVESYGKTKLSNNFFESKLKLPATTRNFNTLQKLIELAKANIA